MLTVTSALVRSRLSTAPASAVISADMAAGMRIRYSTLQRVSSSPQPDWVSRNVWPSTWWAVVGLVLA